MATRMYIEASRKDIAEFMGHDPSEWDTVDRYRQLSKELGYNHEPCDCEWCKLGNGDADYGLHLWLKEHRAADELYHFDLFGLHRITSAAWEYAKKHGLHDDEYGACGGTDNRSHMRALVAMQDPTYLPLVEVAKFVCWS